MFLENQLSWESMGLIDLDASYFVQLVVFLVFLVLMNFLLFKPLLRVLDERKKRTEGTREEAHDKAEEAKRLVAEYEQKLAAAMAQGAALRAELRDAATVEAQKTVSEARSECDKQVSTGSSAAHSEYDKASAGVSTEAQPLAEAIAARLLDTSQKA